MKFGDSFIVDFKTENNRKKSKIVEAGNSYFKYHGIEGVKIIKEKISSTQIKITLKRITDENS